MRPLPSNIIAAPGDRSPWVRNLFARLLSLASTTYDAIVEARELERTMSKCHPFIGS